MASADTVEEVIHLADTFVGRGFYNSIRPLHNPGETRTLTELVTKRRPKVIMEIGTCSGGTLFVWSRCVRDAALIVSVDLYHGNYGGGYHPFRKKLYRDFLHDQPERRLALLQCDSHEAGSLEQVADVLGDKLVDFLFIDGDHTYSGVRQDFEMYSTLVGPGGVIAFHDIRVEDQGCGVHRLWSELRPQFEHCEIVDESAPQPLGVGVLFKPGGNRPVH